MSMTSWKLSAAEDAWARISLMLPHTAAVSEASAPKHKARIAEKSSTNLSFGASLLKEMFSLILRGAKAWIVSNDVMRS